MSGAKSLRRGACPGLTTPMATGDGLLVRLLPVGTLSLDAMAGFCAAAQQHGNGIVEITSRGSLQVRGLSDASAPKFADAVARLGIAAQEGVPVISDPLAGLDPSEVIDAAALAADVRRRLAKESLALSPKISVAIDGGGVLGLDALSADVRLQAKATPDGPRVQVTIGGDVANAVSHGVIAIAEAVDIVVLLLRAIAEHGPEARGRDLRDAAGSCASGFPLPALQPKSDLSDFGRLMVPKSGRPDFGCKRGRERATLPGRAVADPIGLHPLRDGTQALGLGLPFGHADAATLDKLLKAARTAGAGGLRTAPGRTLLIIGVAGNEVVHLVDAAATLGFIVARDDPRRRVVACAGAPICAAAQIPARALAPEIARSAAALLGADDVIHVSGCRKGCAHQGPAALTAIGRDGACDLLVGDAPAGSCAAAALPQRLAALAEQRRTRHG